MEREIQIRVVGCTGSGKTTVAELLQDLLTKEGFNSEHIEVEELSENFSKSKERRLETVKDMVNITIKEVPANRGKGLMA